MNYRGLLEDIEISLLGEDWGLSPYPFSPVEFFTETISKTAFAAPGPSYAEIFGTPGNDNLVGTAGDDVFYPFTGNDTIDGGDGYDILDYSTNSGHLFGYLYQFPMTTVIETYSSAGNFSGTTTFVNIEGIIGGSGDDVINVFFAPAGGVDFYIDGGPGNDLLGAYAADTNIGSLTLIGGDGDDQLNGGVGLDSFDGGSGTDTLFLYNIYFSSGWEAVAIDLRINEVTNDGFGNTETITGVENFSGGSPLADTIHGDDLDNLLGANNGGADNVFGHGGDDLLYLSEAGGTIDGGTGADTLYLTGFRFFNADADMDNRLDFESASVGVSINLSTGQILDDGFGGTGTVSNIENIGGHDLDDTLIGDANDNEIDGGWGDDIIDGGAGTDILILNGVSFDNYLITDNGGGTFIVQDNVGNDGTDTISNIEMLRINGIDFTFGDIVLAFTQNDDVYIGDATDETLNALAGNDNIDGAGGDDMIFGGNGNDILNGGFGNDTLDGGDGDDVLIGGSNTDTFFGSAGADQNIGGSGYDTVDYSASLFGIVLNLTTGGTAGDANGDTYSSIQRVNGSGLNDNLTGTNSDDALYGGDGIDTLNGLDGHDNLFGEGGADTLNGGGGNDKLTGAGGLDTLNGGAGVDLGFGGLGNDIFNGGDNVDKFFGEEGNDTAFGDAGKDVLFGDDGNDTLHGGADDDRVIGRNDDDTLYGDGGADKVKGGFGNDMLFGGDDNDSLFGNADTDVLDGGAGNDQLFGGLGNDTFVFNLSDGAASDRVNDFEISDTVQLNGFGFANAGAAAGSFVQFGSNVKFNSGGVEITFVNATLADVQAAVAVDGLAELPGEPKATTPIAEIMDTPNHLDAIADFLAMADPGRTQIYMNAKGYAEIMTEDDLLTDLDGLGLL